VAKFKAKLTKLGNSEGIFLPKPLRETLKIHVGDDIELEDKEDYITIRKV
jgi:AbrB family looped-hinge helix DNA binding protein